jgi:bifunctional non-homologous end joining protein LigD
LASSIEKVPSGGRWIHEIKFDGYRVQVHMANEAAKIFTRRGHDWTHRFKKVAHDAWRIKANSAVVDGEIVVPAADGTTDFSVLQNELKGKSKSIVLVAFDCGRTCNGCVRSLLAMGGQAGGKSGDHFGRAA